MANRIDMTNKRFGRLVVIKPDKKNRHGDLYWLCKCDCGNIKSINGTKLRNGWTRSCGCLQKDWASEKFSSHKMSDSSLYRIWENMKTRCYNPKSNRFYRYGGRGIKVCDEWLDFNNFVEWALSNGYEEGLSIERKNINQNYEPNNCCWIPLKNQTQNRSNTVWITYQNQTMCMAEFSRIMKVSVNVIRNRIKKGMTGDQMAKEFLNVIN